MCEQLKFLPVRLVKKKKHVTSCSRFTTAVALCSAFRCLGAQASRNLWRQTAARLQLSFYTGPATALRMMTGPTLAAAIRSLQRHHQP